MKDPTFIIGLIIGYLLVIACFAGGIVYGIKSLRLVIKYFKSPLIVRNRNVRMIVILFIIATITLLYGGYVILGYINNAKNLYM